MRTNLALANIRSNLTRSLVSVAGIGVAIVLVFMQLGFRGAVEDTATVVYGKMDFDLMVRSRDYLHFVDCRSVPTSLVQKIHAVPGVERAVPFYVSIGNWLHPDEKRIRGIIIMGTSGSDRAFQDQEVVAKAMKLTSPRFVLIDRKTHREFGPADGRRFGDLDIGVRTDINDHEVEIVDHFEIGAGLTANGAVITSVRGFGRLVPLDTEQRASMILVRTAPGFDPAETQAKIAELIREDDHAVVLSRQQVLNAELRRWIDQTPLGFVFTLGVIVSLIVGSAIVFMVLSNDVSNRLPEYATLKAMGYTNWTLSGVVLQQATWLAILAYIPSLILSLILYQVTGTLANVTIGMNLVRPVAVLALSILVCWVSGIGALRKLWQAEPASLF